LTEQKIRQAYERDYSEASGGHLFLIAIRDKEFYVNRPAYGIQTIYGQQEREQHRILVHAIHHKVRGIACDRAQIVQGTLLPIDSKN